MENAQRNAPTRSENGADIRMTRIAREAAMIEVARTEVRNGLALPESRIEQWFEQVLKATGGAET